MKKTNKLLFNILKSALALMMVFSLTACSKPYDQLEVSDFQYYVYPDSGEGQFYFNCVLKNPNKDYIANGFSYKCTGYDSNDEVVFETGKLTATGYTVLADSSYVYEVVLGSSYNEYRDEHKIAEVKNFEFELVDDSDNWIEGTETLDSNFTDSNFKQEHSIFTADITNNTDKTFSRVWATIVLKKDGKKVYAVNGSYSTSGTEEQFAPGETKLFSMVADTDVPSYDSYEIVYTYNVDDIVK